MTRRGLMIVAALCLCPLGAASSGAAQGTTARSVAPLRVGQVLPRWDRLRMGTRRYLRYVVRGDRRLAVDIWSRTLSIEPDASGARRLRVTQVWTGATNERSLDSWFELNTFRPLSHRTRATRADQIVSAAYLFTPGAVRGDGAAPDNSQAALDVATPEPTFNFETDMELLSTLPWRAGYVARINLYHPGGGAPAWYDFRVTGTERVSFGGRDLDCWVVAIDYGPQSSSRFWIDRQTQTVLRVESRAPDINGTLYKILLPADAPA